MPDRREAIPMRVVPPTEARSVVVFTALFGRSDVIMPPEHRVPGVEYLCSDG